MEYSLEAFLIQMAALSQDGANQPSPAESTGGEAGALTPPVTSAPAYRPNPGEPGAHRPDGSFAPGNSGGAGRPKSRPFREAIKKRLRNNPELLEKIVDDLIEVATGGVIGGEEKSLPEKAADRRQAAEFLRDTLEGRPTQAVEISGGETEEGDQKPVGITWLPPAENKL